MWIRALRWVFLMSLVQSATSEDRITVDELPTLELLDYLGQLVETDGELVGPGVAGMLVGALVGELVGEQVTPQHERAQRTR